MLISKIANLKAVLEVIMRAMATRRCPHEWAQTKRIAQSSMKVVTTTLMSLMAAATSLRERMKARRWTRKLGWRHIWTERTSWRWSGSTERRRGAET
jgi:hypothetical protein